MFNTAVSPYSISASHFGLMGPGGQAIGGLGVSTLGPSRFRISFPQQTAQGTYTLTVGPQIQDLSGQAMSQVCTSTFAIAWVVVQGTVTDTNGLPVPGVRLQPNGGLSSATTDINGNYVLSLPPAGIISVVPSKAGFILVPSYRTYASLTASIVNENYLAVNSVLPTLVSQVQSNNFRLNWYGISGVSYQPLYSTNLVDWVPYDVPLPGTNGPLQLLFPVDGGPIKFFRVGATY